MGEFSDAPKWRLVNSHTIYTDHDLHDRPMMLTSVPQRIEIEVDRFEVVRSVDWPFIDDRTQHPGLYADRSSLMVSGSMRDRIVVFTMADGEVARYDRITDLEIRAAPAGAVGGEFKASTLDGVAYAGMTSHDVPDGGLMKGEPGRLFYLPDYDEPRGGKTTAHLTGTVYVDEDRLRSLLSDLVVQRGPVRLLRVVLVVELFETETSASLSEPWMRRDYGMLMRSETSAHAVSRLEGVYVGMGQQAIGVVEDLGDAPPGAPLPSPVAAPAAVDLAPVVRVLRSILGVLVVLTLALVFLR